MNLILDSDLDAEDFRNEMPTRASICTSERPSVNVLVERGGYLPAGGVVVSYEDAVWRSATARTSVYSLDWLVWRKEQLFKCPRRATTDRRQPAEAV